MENSETAYCRLCADLKQCSDVSNLEEINSEKRNTIINKLARFNIKLNLNNDLPKTVCYKCVKSLDLAYDFVTTVDLAQDAFSEYIGESDVDLKQDKVEVKSVESVHSEDPLDPNNDSDSRSYYDDNETLDRSSIDNDDKEEVMLESSKPVSKEIVLKSETAITIKKEKVGSEPKLEKTQPKRVRIRKKKVDAEFCESWNEYTWLCAHCSRRCSTAKELIIHSMQYHHTCNAYRCYDCKGRGLHLNNFLQHIHKHRPLLILTCHKCSLECTSLQEIKKHQFSHINSLHYCTGCNTPFENQKDLDEHINKFYKNRDSLDLTNVVHSESLTCIICNKTSKNKILLNRHLRIHTDRTRDHICDICGSRFYHKKQLVQHNFVHSELRPYTCEVCKYSFKIKSELKKHLVTVHFGPKRFRCETCGRHFRRKKELEIHSIVHTEDRPFICTICDRTFRFRHLLIQHNRLHTGLKPYSCDNCPLAFRNWSNYNKHMKEMHGVDKAKRRHTSDGLGLYAIDPVTGDVVYPEEDKVIEWKNKILKCERLGRPRKQDLNNSIIDDDEKSKNDDCYVVEN